jgi:hypothetical protein
VALGLALPVRAATSVDTVGVDLNPLIDAAARSPQQFAVNVRHAISSSAQGAWSKRGSTLTWTYSTRIPTAISMSFHAPDVVLPPSAVLTVRTGGATVQYRARDVGRAGLWSRPMPGDTLSLSLSVESTERSRVRLQIESLQAGYRSLGGGVRNHSHYQELMTAAAAATDCAENYSCHVTADNQGPAHATVALIIGNLYQCSGTLLNDTLGDGVPYVLTARHCEEGELGGGYPDRAATVSVYWDAVAACGADLGSIYSTGTVSQTGATTALEQQDIWLIQLESPPAATDAYYAGWDATGSAFTGGYTIHHGLGQSKQYVEWNGTDVLEQIRGTTLGLAYDSTFWGVVNGLGNLSPGGSGSALFSPSNLVVGSASLGEVIKTATSSVGVCPANPPAAPAPSTATALFTALSGVWTSTADPSSATGSKTLRSLLDPNATGQKTLGGLATQPFTLSASSAFANTGDPVTLTWDVPGGVSCTARGGSTGDGWAGPQPATGSMQVTNAAGGVATYSMNCRVGNGIASGAATVTWDFIQPLTNLTGGASVPLMLGATWNLNWVANVTPCVASGGVAGDGWAGAQPENGSFTVTVTQTGMTQYTLTCGTGARTATQSVFVDGVAPYITLVTDTTKVAVNQNFQLSWFGNGVGGACAASGGSSTDNWALFNSHVVSNGSTLLRESTAGTYTYTLTCSGGGSSASSSVSVVVTDDPPAISLTALAPQQQIYSPSAQSTPSSAANLVWTSNVGACAIDYTSNGGIGQAVVLSGGTQSGVVTDVENQAGLVTYTLRCSGQSLVATATIDWVTTPVPSVLSVAQSSWATNVSYPLSWNATSGPCVGSGGASGDGWAGSKALTGTQSVSEAVPGTYVFTLQCGSGSSAVTSQVAVNVPPPFIQVYSTSPPIPDSPPATEIVWQSTVGPCTYLDGSSGASVGVPVPPSGNATPTPAASGTYLFSVTCGSGSGTVYGATLAPVTVEPPTTLAASAQTAPVETAITLNWSAPSGRFCYAVGGDGNPPWTGTLGSGSGSVIVTSRYAGAITYGITCGSQTASASVTVTYVSVPAASQDGPTPSVTLSASTSTQAEGKSISLTWSSKNADVCTASGGQAGDGWGGTLALEGSQSLTETSAGTVNYSVVCSGAPPAAAATTTVVVTAASTPPASNGAGGGGGGGGALDRLFLLFISVCCGLRALRTLTRTTPRMAPASS